MDPDKAELRQRLLAARRALTPADIEAARAAIRAHVLARLEPTVRRVAAYRPLRTEPGSDELIDELTARGIQVLVPVLRDDRDLDWASADAPAQCLGLEAVATVDLVLVPALAVDARGTRLGRGGGSYDRALTRVGRVPVAALVYDGELLPTVPADPWDRPVDAAVTPSGWHAVGGPGWTGNAGISHHG